MILEEIVPWDKMAVIFFDRLDRYQGRGSIDLRIVMGAMFIQHSLNLTDRETIQIIQENIYMQYFVGLSSFQIHGVFDHSLLSVFRKRLGKKGSKALNDIFIAHAVGENKVKHRKTRTTKLDDDQEDSTIDPMDSNEQIDLEGEQDKENKVRQENKGTVKIDATVVPHHISYPTDTKLLNHARQISEKLVRRK